jgi:hypothetical protein
LNHPSTRVDEPRPATTRAGRTVETPRPDGGAPSAASGQERLTWCEERVTPQRKGTLRADHGRGNPGGPLEGPNPGGPFRGKTPLGARSSSGSHQSSTVSRESQGGDLKAPTSSRSSGHRPRPIGTPTTRAPRETSPRSGTWSLGRPDSSAPPLSTRPRSARSPPSRKLRRCLLHGILRFESAVGSAGERIPRGKVDRWSGEVGSRCWKRRQAVLGGPHLRRILSEMLAATRRSLQDKYREQGPPPVLGVPMPGEPVGVGPCVRFASGYRAPSSTEGMTSHEEPTVSPWVSLSASSRATRGEDPDRGPVRDGQRRAQPNAHTFETTP